MKRKCPSFFVAVLLCAAICGTPASAAPVISELMASNSRILADDDGEFSDWLEIHNPSGAPINLDGYYLTDDQALLTRWRFPNVSIAAHGYLLVFASGKNRTNAAARLHTNFELDAGGEVLALVAPDGTTVIDGFFPFPEQREDVSFGLAQKLITTSLLADAAPRILVPTNEAALPPIWSSPSFIPDSSWLTGIAPPAIGFDTNQAPPVPVNVARQGSALQSTTAGANAANLAINGITTDFSQTLNTDTDPFWQVTLAGETAVHQVILRNRTSCCGSRLRDITIEVLATNSSGSVTSYVSALLNPENTGFTYPAGPASLQVDIVALTGNPGYGHIIRVHRAPDPDLSGSGGQGGTDEAAVLALGEVEVIGVPVAVNEVNLARTGTPAPTATQSSTNASFRPELALNGILSDFTHTLGTDTSASWTLNLGRTAIINAVTLHNRSSCCQSRLRDITVEILASDAATVVYTSPLLNPENIGFAFPGGPSSLTVSLSNSPAAGHYVRVRRTSDPDLSGSGGQGDANEASVLSLAEVVVLGVDIGGYRPFIRSDLQSAMLGQNASAFVRIPFVAEPASLRTLALRIRYDDGFACFLNGTPIGARNALLSPTWDSTATASRTLGQGIAAETIDLTSQIPLLTANNVLAFQGLNVSASDADFLLQPELLATFVSTSNGVFLTDATPEALNDTEFYVDEVDDTQFSVNRGFFEAPFQLEITTPTPEAAIYYSFDSSEPEPGQGTLYTAPITISNTTVLRARAFRPGWKQTDVDTHTFLFLADVVNQATNWPATNSTPQYFPTTWGRNSNDYGMDPVIVAQYTPAQWKEAFTQIPTMSVVTEMGNLFDPNTGIYANADGHGEVWERPTSLELLDPTNSFHGRFQENCGLRIRGGASRQTSFRKHSFRVFFRREYGAGRLNYPLFEDEGAQEFDKFDLRTAQNYSWPRETNFEVGKHDTMVREVFCRETLGAMGQPYRRSRYYHLYVNGHYWGLYETDERPEAAYGETYFGGDQDDYDVVKCGNRGTNPQFITEATDGNLIAFSNLWTMCRSHATNATAANYFRILGRNPDGSRNPALPVMLDVDNLIDYMLGIFYTGDGDATLSAFLSNNRPNNWFGMRNRNDPDMGFRFFNSDCEHTLGSPNSQVDRTGPFRDVSGSNLTNFTYANPQYLHEDLLWNAEYRLLFADHVHKHMFNGGALTFQEVTNRFMRKAVQIDKAVRAYSARWGDAVREPPYHENDWKAEISWILTNWFPPRAAIVLQQLRLDGLYPSNGAPVFSQHGGEIPEDFALTISHTNLTGTIYYTTDGTDPRLAGGGVSGNAAQYTDTIFLDSNTRVKARVLIGGVWSPLTQADFAVPNLQPLRVTEIMYHPAPLTETEQLAGFIDNNDFEYIELRNVGSRPVHLAGVTFNAGISFSFSSGSLAAGERVLLVKSVEAFTNRYGAAANIAGVYGGRLDNAGERLRLEDSFGRTIHDFSYSDEWYPTTDGFGFSLVIVDDSQPVSTWGNKASWRASSTLNGSPGQPNPTAPVFPFVVINEVLSRPEPSDVVTIELANLGDTDADVSHWWLTDAFRTPKKFRLPNTIIPRGGFVTFTADQFNAPTQGQGAFTYSGNAGEVRLFSGNADGDLTGYFQGWDFGAADPGISFGRHVTSTGADHLVAQSSNSLDDTNAGPRVGPVVITEIMYRPPDDGIFDNDLDEFVELQNVTDNPVALYETTSPSNTWTLTGGIDMVFPTNITLAAGDYLLLVNFDPADSGTAQHFRNLYGVPEGIRLLGPYSGKLDNSGEDIEIKKPTLFESGLPGTVLVDKVSYRDSSPWDPAADGFGLSLHRITTSAYGNDPISWRAMPPTGAAPAPGAGEAPTVTNHPQDHIVRTGANVLLSVGAAGPATLRYQWRINGVNIEGATNATLQLTGLQPIDSGEYLVLVYNDSGAVLSETASLVVVAAPQLFGPQDVLVAPGSNAVLSVQATSARPLSYQWRFDNQDIQGATGPTLAINDVELADDGIYSVVVQDDINDPVVGSARLIVAVQPLIVQQPLSQAVVQGGNVTLSVVMSNTTTFPIAYRWRRGTAFILTNVVNSYTDFFVVTNVQPGQGTTLFAAITNPARTNFVVTSIVNLQVLADVDADGLPDVWEVQHRFETNNPTDGTNDFDLDTMSNWAEYIAGTNPTNDTSYLRISEPVLGGGTRLDFFAVSNRTYTITYRNVIDANWSKLRDFAARATNRTEIIFDTNGTPGSRYYQLITPRQP